MRKWSLALVLAAVALLARVEGQPRERDQPRGRPEGFVQGELLVKFTSALSPAQRDAVLSNRHFTRLRRFEALDIDLVRVPPGLAVAAAAGGLRALSGIVMVQPNYLRYAVQSAPPNDPFWLEGRLWGLERIHAPRVWNGYSHGDDRVVIASIDTGINYGHPDLAANMWRNPLEFAGNGIDDDGNGYVDDVFGIDVRNRDSDPLDDQGHGTLMAGTMAAAGNNAVGVVGVTWNAKLLACKFLGADGIGTDAGAIECFNYIVGLKNRGVNIRVSANGWGASRNDGLQGGALKAAIDAAGAAGILNVFGAGNGGDNDDRDPFDPASFRSSSIVSVASSDRSDGRSDFSNYGGGAVDLAAPGEHILTTHRDAYAYASGTSMAAAHVAGAAALLAGLDPTLSPDGIKVILLRSVDPLPEWGSRVASGGRLNLFRAVKAVGVDPNKPPSVSIKTPAEHAVLTTPVNVTISAVADDADGTVKQVAFYANGALVGTATTGAFSVAWSPAVIGDYTLTAVATDNLGATATSALVKVTVVAPNAPPTVSMTSPSAGASFVAPATVPLTASASDTDGSVSSVTFYANGVSIGVDSSSPFSMSWSPVAAGQYLVTAVATDNRKATTTSAGVSIVVVAQNVPPTVSLTGPIAGALFVAPASVPLSAMAADTDGSVASVTFYADGVPIGVDTVSPFAMSWAPVAPGQHTLTAVATDNQNATTTSASVSIVVVAPNVPPVVSLVAPATGASFAAPASVPLAAIAGDADGSVTSVSFFVNGDPIGSDTSSPFNAVWSTVTPGTYTLTASATDNAGATSVSPPVVVTVTPPVRMNVALSANGGVASASSTFTINYPASGANNGDRRGLNWGAGGGWNDGTPNAAPDWLAIAFDGPKTIDEVSVFSLQDAFTAPVEPTETLTFTQWGLRGFEIQYWDGFGWATVPGASTTTNNLVWRRFTFTPITTTAIRVFITAALQGSSRVIEVEAWGTAALGNTDSELLPSHGVDARGIEIADRARNAELPWIRRASPFMPPTRRDR